MDDRYVIETDELDRRDPYRTFLRGLELRQVLGREPAKKLLYVWLRSVFANYHMAADRIDMAHAVEVRLPCLDHVLFERAREIPVGLLVKNGRQKHLLREIGRPYVTAAAYDGPKRPFYAPPSAVAAGTALHELVQGTLRSAALEAVPFFDSQGATELLDRLPSLDPAARATVEPILLTMASLCVLQERFGPTEKPALRQTLSSVEGGSCGFRAQARRDRHRRRGGGTHDRSARRVGECS